MSQRTELVGRARELADGPLLERASRYDREGCFPAENYRDLHDAGLLSLSIPQRFGGQGAAWTTWLAVLREIARGCGSTANGLNMHTTVLRFIARLSTEELKALIFSGVVEEGALVATLTNEPQMSLRTAFALQTTVEEVEGRLRVQGAKHFCSLSSAARWYHVICSDPRREREERFRSVLVPAKSHGIQVAGDWDVMAMRATDSSSVTFERVDVDPGLETAPPGVLFRSGMQEYFTPGYAALYLGVADAAFRFAKEHATTTTYAGRDEPISHRPAAQWATSEMSVAIAAAEALVERAGVEADSLAPLDASLHFLRAKYAACNAARDVAAKALELCGGRALSKRFELERYVRDAQAGHLMQPTADVCRTRIGRLELGLDPFAP